MATKTTKLQAINTLLSNIGQAPVNTLDSINPQVQMAERVLDEVSGDVQTQGWIFNTEQKYPFTPDINTNQIAIPSNVIRLDLPIDCPPSMRYDPVIRQGKLYDRLAHSYTFTKTQYLDVIWLFEWEDLPEAAKQYILIRAANLFAMRATGSVEVAKYSEREEATARANLIEYECDQGDYSIFSDGTGYNPTRSFMPLNTIFRY